MFGARASPARGAVGHFPDGGGSVKERIERTKRPEELDASAREVAPAKVDQPPAFELQRAAGNRSAGAFLQPKLEVGPADDAYEREADEIASQVVGGGGGADTGHASPSAGGGF